jgi:hypothetical protein
MPAGGLPYGNKFGRRPKFNPKKLRPIRPGDIQMGGPSFINQKKQMANAVKKARPLAQSANSVEGQNQRRPAQPVMNVKGPAGNRQPSKLADRVSRLAKKAQRRVY